uniref:Growth hormone-regulated TBC protein 1 n=1 Tax=Hydra vulgaris TaxID=6087 RepID=T2MBZ9_HYDVU
MGSINGEIDTYGFMRQSDFDYDSYETFMNKYLRILAKRLSKWEKLMKNKESVKRTRKVKRYIRKGIPSNFRTEVWMYASFAQFNKEKFPNKYSEILAHPNLDKVVIDSIELDIKRTYPDNIYFKELDDSLLKPLSNVLTAYASYNRNVGYCQGLNYIAGMLLLVTKDESNTFWLLVQLLDKFVPDFYTSRMLGLRVECQVLDLLIKSSHPDLHEHFKIHNITIELFVSKWFICLFVDVLPVETVLRLWDCLFYEGSKILLRAAFTLIIINKKNFLQLNEFTEICNLFKNIPLSKETLDCHYFLQCCFNVPKSFPMSKVLQLRDDASQSLLSSVS